MAARGLRTFNRAQQFGQLIGLVAVVGSIVRSTAAQSVSRPSSTARSPSNSRMSARASRYANMRASRLWSVAIACGSQPRHCSIVLCIPSFSRLSTTRLTCYSSGPVPGRSIPTLPTLKTTTPRRAPPSGCFERGTGAGNPGWHTICWATCDLLSRIWSAMSLQVHFSGPPLTARRAGPRLSRLPAWS